MSKWKPQIDRELGSEQKFSKALEQKIIQKSSKQSSKNVAYPLTLVGVCFIALILFFTWPENTPQQLQTNGDSLLINNLVNTDSISAVYVSYLYPNDDQFFAQSNTLAFGIAKISEENDIQVVEQMFDKARLGNQSWSSYNYDVIIKLKSGKERKIKIYDINDSIGILDLETNLYYEVEGDYTDVFRKTKDNANSLGFLFTVLNLIAFLLICVNPKDRAPHSLKIYLTYIALTVSVFLLQGQNILLPIWIPVAILIGLALYRIIKLQQEEYPIEKLRKLKLYTILLIVMWSVIFVLQLIGGGL